MKQLSYFPQIFFGLLVLVFFFSITQNQQSKGYYYLSDLQCSNVQSSFSPSLNSQLYSSAQSLAKDDPNNTTATAFANMTPSWLLPLLPISVQSQQEMFFFGFQTLNALEFNFNQNNYRVQSGMITNAPAKAFYLISGDYPKSPNQMMVAQSLLDTLNSSAHQILGQTLTFKQTAYQVVAVYQDTLTRNNTVASTEGYSEPAVIFYDPQANMPQLYYFLQHRNGLGNPNGGRGDGAILRNVLPNCTALNRVIPDAVQNNSYSVLPLQPFLLLTATITLSISCVGLFLGHMSTLNSQIKLIALKRTFGASQRTIFYDFFWKNQLTVLLFSLVSLLIIYAIYPIFANFLIIEFGFPQLGIEWFSLLLSLLVFIFFSGITTIYPSYAASQIEPALAVKDEEL